MASRWLRPTVLFVVWSVCASCGSGGSSDSGASADVTDPPVTASTLPHTTAPSSAPSTTPTTTPSTTPGTDPDAAPPDPDAPLVDDTATCDPQWSELSGDVGEVTFTRDDSLYSYDLGTGKLHCLGADVGDGTRLDWNPAGSRLLIGERNLLDADGLRDSGISDGTNGTSWSRPVGNALITTGAVGGKLVHVDATDPADVSDIGALTTTWAAAYHPSGLAIISAGIDGAGSAGLFIADNTGADVRQLVDLNDPDTKITEVVVSSAGNWATFIHDHRGGSIDDGAAAHIHRFSLGELFVDDIAALADDVPTDLTTSEQYDGTIAWSQPTSGGGVETMTWPGPAGPRRIGDPNLSTRPVGFVDGDTVVVTVRTANGADDVGELWLYPPDGDPVLVARGVSAATSRTIPHDTWIEPPLRIDQRAVG